MSTKTDLIEVKSKDITTRVLARIDAFEKSGELVLPKNYSPANALKSAQLILMETTNKSGQKALDHCTTESIANALLDMVVKGLSVMKKQGNFIMYGNRLAFEPEYAGNIAMAKRFGGLLDIKGHAIFEGDVFEFSNDVETGRKIVTKHQQKLENLGSKKIKGAYAVKFMADGTRDVEIMDINQIRDSWNQGPTKGQSPAHKNFPDQMAIKTVINRACKLLIRGSDDAGLLGGEEEGDRTIDVTAADVDHEVATKANGRQIGFDDVEDAHVVDDAPAPELDQEQENQRLYEEAMAEENGNQNPGF